MFLDFFDGEQIDWKSGRSIWKTHNKLCYESELLGTKIIVPKDFITDLASVPRLPLLWLATGGRGIRSAVIHDFAYQFGFWLTSKDRIDVSKRLADDVFHESLLADPISGAGRIRAWEMWFGVRVGGRGMWSSKKRVSELNPIWSKEWQSP